MVARWGELHDRRPGVVEREGVLEAAAGAGQQGLAGKIDQRSKGWVLTQSDVPGQAGLLK